MFLLPDGRVLYAGETSQTSVLDPGAQTWGPIIGGAVEGLDGSAAMYRPGKILRVSNQMLTDRAQVLDMTSATPEWCDAAPFTYPRSNHTLVQLPDGTVLMVGGGTGFTDPAGAILTPELWNPDTDRWTSLASMIRPRQYHSTALLLPDGRVLAAGGENCSTDCDEALDRGETAPEIFSPPYLTSGLPRPTITSVTSSIIYGGNFVVGTPSPASIGSVALIRPGSVTHGFDQNQRYVPLAFIVSRRKPATSLNVTAPTNANIAPPGPYMLFLVSTDGVPSVGRFIQVGPTNPLGPVCDNDGICEPGEDSVNCVTDCPA